MRTGLWLLLAWSCITVIGCGEFVRTDEQTTTIDVVGEPADPISNSKEQADILGSAMLESDDSDSITDSNSTPVESNFLPDETDDSNADVDEPDAAPSIGSPKPPRLKTASQKFSNSK